MTKTPRLIDIEEACRQLGIEVATMYRWVQMRKIPFYKIGRYVKFEQDELNAWIISKKVDEFEIA